MVKRIISVLLSVAVIAGFASVCSAAGEETSDIHGTYSYHIETCSYDGGVCADILVLSAEVLKNYKPLVSNTKTWTGDDTFLSKKVTAQKGSANMGYHTGYYLIGNYMYYNQGYDD